VKILAPTGIRTPTSSVLQPVASRYTDYAIPTKHKHSVEAKCRRFNVKSGGIYIYYFALKSCKYGSEFGCFKKGDETQCGGPSQLDARISELQYKMSDRHTNLTATAQNTPTPTPTFPCELLLSIETLQ
jgi:hypothetical protein